MTQTATITRHDNSSEFGLTVVHETNKVDMVLMYAYANMPDALHIVRWTDQSGEPAQEMILSLAEGQQFLTRLSELDARGLLQAAPVYHEPIKNAVHTDGTPCSETFGTVHAEKWDCTEQHDFAYCSDRRLILSDIPTNRHMELDQAETVQMFNWLQQVYARVNQEHFSVREREERMENIMGGSFNG